MTTPTKTNNVTTNRSITSALERKNKYEILCVPEYDRYKSCFDHNHTEYIDNELCSIYKLCILTVCTLKNTKIIKLKHNKSPGKKHIQISLCMF